MNKMQRILLVIGLIILSLSTINAKTNLAEVTIFSDNFDDGIIDPIWTKYADSGVDITEMDGVLKTTVPALDSNEKSVYLYKDITNETMTIEVDYNFDFKSGMGRIYLIGKDATNTMNTWLVGLGDGWSATNARPIIYGYDSNGVYQPGISWNSNDVNSNKLVNSGGNGHIRVNMNSTSNITVEFTFPLTYDGLTSKNYTLPIANITEKILLYFWYPPISTYATGEVFEFDNYTETKIADSAIIFTSTTTTTVTSTITEVITSTETSIGTVTQTETETLTDSAIPSTETRQVNLTTTATVTENRTFTTTEVPPALTQASGFSGVMVILSFGWALLLIVKKRKNKKL